VSRRDSFGPRPTVSSIANAVNGNLRGPRTRNSVKPANRTTSAREGRTHARIGDLVLTPRSGAGQVLRQRAVRGVITRRL
jgi:hypothetical protein